MCRMLVVGKSPLYSRIIEIIRRDLKPLGLTAADSLEEAEQVVANDHEESLHAILAAVTREDADGLRRLRRIKQLRPDIQCLLATDADDQTQALEYIIQNAADSLLVSTNDTAQIRAILCHSFNNIRRNHEGITARKLMAERSLYHIIGVTSPKMKVAVALADKATTHNSPVLISGHASTGKSLFARAIHGSGLGAEKPFVGIVCGDIPARRMAAVLFGDDSGGSGKLAQADGGTLYVKDLDKMKLPVQKQLLRVLQGKRETDASDDNIHTALPRARFIFSTPSDLAHYIHTGHLYEPLISLLQSRCHIALPPLKERKEDFNFLLDYFFAKISVVENREVRDISDEAREYLKSFSWPGNVGQLEQVLRAIILSCDGEYISKADAHYVIESLIGQFSDKVLPVHANGLGNGAHISLLDEQCSTVRPFNSIEREIIETALKFYDGKIAKAAQYLGIGRSTLYRKIVELNIPMNKRTRHVRRLVHY